MTNKIITKKGIIIFEEKTPIAGTKTLDIKTARKNLLDVKKILDFHNIKFGLIYGTLLGAIRENNFIELMNKAGYLNFSNNINMLLTKNMNKSSIQEWVRNTRLKY